MLITGSMRTVGTVCATGNTCFGGMSVVASCLGIGTNTPSEALHLYGTGTSPRPALFIETCNSNATPEVRLYQTSGRSILMNLQTNGDWSFQNSANNSSYNPRMTIVSGGNIGIGVSTPCKTFHVYSGGNEVAYFQGTTTGAWIDIKSAASNLWSIGAADGCAFAIYNRTCGSTVFYLRNNGNLGIGTENPYFNAKFQVKTETNINLAVQTGTTDVTGVKLNVFNDIGNTNIPFELNGNTLHFKTCEVPRLTFNGVGTACFSCQVYIGTNKICWTDTTFKTLQVGNGAFNNINNQTQIVNNIYYDDANYRSLIGGASNRLIMSTSGDLYFEYACVATAGSTITLSPKLFICGINGRIGMGTISPGSKLHLYGSDAELGIQIAKDGSDSVGQGPYIALQNLTNSRQWLNQLTADNHLATYYWGGGGYVEKFRINSSGAVTMPGQPSMLAQPGASTFSVGGSGSTAYGWCTSGGIRYNCGFTLQAATSLSNNVADAANTGKIRIPATGKYLLQFSQRNENIRSTGQFQLYVNGTIRIRRHIELWACNLYIHVDVTAILALNTDDCLEMGAYFNTSGCSDTFSGTGDTVNWLSLAKIS
jgi:hypothetical protein